MTLSSEILDMAVAFIRLSSEIWTFLWELLAGDAYNNAAESTWVSNERCKSCLRERDPDPSLSV